MNETDNKKIEYFIALCDDLITCKFLVAESKIKKLLVALAETEPICSLVAECMEQFNRDREFNKTFVADGKGHFYCFMPTEEYKIIALVFCVLADIDKGKDRGGIDFTDFIKRYFDDEEGVNCYTHFARKIILPFRELIAEAFSFPKRYAKESEGEEETSLKNVFDGDEDLLPEPFATQQKFLKDCMNIAQDMLVEIDEYERKHDEHVKELKTLLTQLILSAKENDLERTYALAVGAKYACKGVKSVKFLLRELICVVDDYTFSLEEE